MKMKNNEYTSTNIVNNYALCYATTEKGMNRLKMPRNQILRSLNPNICFMRQHFLTIFNYVILTLNENPFDSKSKRHHIL